MNGIKDFNQLKPNNLVSELVKFIENELPLFSDSKEFISILEKKKNENQHSMSFCVFMTNKCKSKFYFGRENAQNGSSVIDIGIYFGNLLIFTIEAKLLPTPPKKDRNEFEYVYGNGAGIQRFKEGKHGVDNNDNQLPENGLLAYINNEDFQYWVEKINKWILDAGWDKSEQLQKSNFSTIAKHISNHIRSNSSSLTLHHFWVKVF